MHMRSRRRTEIVRPCTILDVRFSKVLLKKQTEFGSMPLSALIHVGWLCSLLHMSRSLLPKRNRAGTCLVEEREML